MRAALVGQHAIVDRLRPMATGTLATRMLWPFMRVNGPSVDPAHLKRLGVDVATLADPETRISHDVARELLAASVQRTGNPALGLLAGERVEAIDMGVLHYATRNCPDLHSALNCASRFMRLADSLLEGVLIEQVDRATWELRMALPTPLPQTNDFQVTFALRSIQWFRASQDPPIEVRLRHREATDARHYARLFRCPVVLGAEHNAIVFPHAWLNDSLAGASPDLLPAFEDQAQRLLSELSQNETTSARVRRLMLKEMGNGQATMGYIARQLHMSASTLRRRLDAEGTTHSALLDQARRDLAVQQVKESRLSIGELSLLLGFSNPAAFSRAFRRWTGMSPIEFRARE